MKIFSVLGVMTGTSADGVDLALIKTNGVEILVWGPMVCYPFTTAEKTMIKSWFGRNDLHPTESDAAKQMTALLARAVKQFFKDFPIKELDAVAIHGQTIWHDPSHHQTCQLADGQALANDLGLKVIWDFRTEDLKNGGMGAPLIPVMHAVLKNYCLAESQKPKSVIPVAVRRAINFADDMIAVVNVGGVANITLLANQADYFQTASSVEALGYLLAGDVGVGNALSDDYCRAWLNCDYDRDGFWAGQGQINQALLAQWLSDDFFKHPLPKALDRDYFQTKILNQLKPTSHGTNNQEHYNHLASLTAFTANGIMLGIKQCLRLTIGNKPRLHIWLAGGGARHKTLWAMLQQQATMVTNFEIHLWQLSEILPNLKLADGLEAYGFGLLAARVLNNYPNSFPQTTGVKIATRGGQVSLPKKNLNRNEKYQHKF